MEVFVDNASYNLHQFALGDLKPAQRKLGSFQVGCVYGAEICQLRHAYLALEANIRRMCTELYPVSRHPVSLPVPR